jgi:hypothetical protein
VAAAGSGRGQSGLDALLAFLVLVLAFLSASFVARNSDLWFHLATGRLLASGRWQSLLGTDPFAYTTAGTYWANHSWLFDLLLFGLYRAASGAGLVVFKALLVAALAALLLQVRRPGGGAWLPAIGTTLAVLAMSPRLLLQPACVSYFLLGLTFWLLWRAHAADEQSGPVSWTRRLALPVLFVLWVNIDEWFLLGPLLAALFWLGDRLRGQRRIPGWVVTVGLAACLLNPHTFHAFTLPAELSPVSFTSGLRQDVRFQALFASPWQAEYLHAALRLHAAALAYFALTLLGLVSFLVHRQALRDWRLLVWLPFALLAAWQARAIPFFAVVAAPITALNWQDFLAARSLARTGPPAPVSRRRRFGLLGGRVLLVAGLLALLFLTWLGGLAGYDREDRHVAWGIEADPALQQVTETLARWRRQGLLLDDEQVFALGPEVAQYGAWFDPGERHFFDHRYALFPRAARDYETVCRALLPGSGAGRTPAGDWRQVLRDHHAGIVVYSAHDPQHLFAVLHRLAGDPRHWTLLHVAGSALIVGWNEARPPGTFAPLAFDADRFAFGPQEDAPRWTVPAAPPHGPEHLPQRRGFWDRLARPAATPSWESAAATVYLDYFQESEAAQRQQQWRLLGSSYAASVAGLAAQPAAVPQVLFQVVSAGDLLLLPEDAEPQFLVRDQLGPFFAPMVERPPGLPLLAVRAARRAVAANPRDANAWLRLGHAYLLLRNLTCERSSEGMLPPLAQVRHVQIATALEQALRLDPDQEAAHHELAMLYGERNYLDQALEHQREELRLSRRAGPRSGETAEDFAYRLEHLEKDTAKLVALVQDRRKTYASGSPSLQGDRLAQAGLALRLGLGRLAVEEVLLPTPAELLRPAGIKLELELLLTLGRAEEVRTILSDQALQASKQRLGPYDLAPPRNRDGVALYGLAYHWPAYEWLHLLTAAALGDYADARADLGVSRAVLRTRNDRMRQTLADSDRRARAFLPALLSGPPPFVPAVAAEALVQLREEKTLLEIGERSLRAQQADLCVLEGLLALEQGDTEAASAAFALTQKLCEQPAEAAVPFAARPIAAGYLGKVTNRSAQEGK